MRMFITIDASDKALPYVEKFGEDLRAKFGNEGYSVQVLNDPFGSPDIKRGLLKTIESTRGKSGVGPKASYLMLLAARAELLEYICTTCSSEIVILLGGPWKWLQDQHAVVYACNHMHKDVGPFLGLAHELAKPYWPNLCVYVSLPSEDENLGFDDRSAPALCMDCETNSLEDDLVRVLKRAVDLIPVTTCG